MSVQIKKPAKASESLLVAMPNASTMTLEPVQVSTMATVHLDVELAGTKTNIVAFPKKLHTISNDQLETDKRERLISALYAVKPVNYHVVRTMTWGARWLGLTLTDLVKWAHGYKEEKQVMRAWISDETSTRPEEEKQGAGPFFELAKKAEWKDPNPSLAFSKLKTAPVPLNQAQLDELMLAQHQKKIEFDPLFNLFPEATLDNDYLLRKGGGAFRHGLKAVPKSPSFSYDGKNVSGHLVVPIKDFDGYLYSAQFIPPEDGAAKIFPAKLKLSRKIEGQTGKAHGLYFIENGYSGASAEWIYVVEGPAHAWTVCAVAPKSAYACSFGSGRLKDVALEVQKHYPKAKIAIIADRGAEDEAIEAAQALKDGFYIVLPPDIYALKADINDAFTLELAKKGLDLPPGHAQQYVRELLAAKQAAPQPVVEAGKVTYAPSLAYPHLKGTDRVECRLEDLVMALEARVRGLPALGFDVSLDAVVVMEDGVQEQRSLQDTDFTAWRILVEREGFYKIGKDDIRDAVYLVASKNQFDGLANWVGGLKWDGAPRVAKFAEKYLCLVPSPYHTAVSLYLWTALAGRALEPGCQADYVPLLMGKEGTRKTSAVLAIAPKPEYFMSLDFTEKSADLFRKLRGKVVVEWSEMQGMRKREEEHVKAFVTTRFEDHRNLYKEFAGQYARRFILIGTTNELNVLPAHGEARRWFPLHIEKLIDTDAMEADRDQLWAEAAVLFAEHGILWKEADSLACGVRDDFREEDPLHSPVVTWLEKNLSPSGFPPTNVERHGFNLSDLTTYLREATHAPVAERKVGTLLRALGWGPRRYEDKKQKRTRWFKKTE